VRKRFYSRRPARDNGETGPFRGPLGAAPRTREGEVSMTHPGRVPGGRPGTAGEGLRSRRMDERDLGILAALQEDARTTYVDIGRRVGLSASSVHQRVRKLEEQGVIRGYRVMVDPEALGLFVTALISVMPLDPKQPDDLPDRVEEFSEIEDCLSVAGHESYVLKVRTRTTADLEDLLRRLREKAGVQTRTTVVLSIPFEQRPVKG
jgi:Lrp/AsnC family transcriptional regulator, leucine-responsive regulatory protein